MKKIFKILGGFLVACLLLVVAFFGFLMITEFNPEEVETLTIENPADKNISITEPISILSYNIGYCALSEGEDFFMDGGTEVRPSSKDIISQNVEGIIDLVKSYNPDVTFVQEIDEDSTRSYHINEYKAFSDAFGKSSALAYNFVCKFIPYPLPPIMAVKGGIAIYNSYAVEEAKRIRFPSAFSWPISMCQLKRCLLVERCPIEGSDKEVVFVNLHLEAYDSGEGKLEQSLILANVLKEEYEKGNYVIAGGDFNQSFSTVDKEKYPLKLTEDFLPGIFPEDEFDEHWSFWMDDRLPTCRLLNQPYDPDSEMTQYYMLDGFIVSDNVKVESLETIDTRFKHSDHNPVLLTIRLEEDAE